MFRSKYSIRVFFSTTLIASLVFSAIAVFPQDLVTSDDLTGGSSVFIFRESRKKPQAKRSGNVAFRSRRGSRGRQTTQLAAYRKRRTENSKRSHAALARSRARQRQNARLKLSETQTAQAETMLGAGQTDKAIETYRSAIKNNPKNTDAAEGLSEALTAKGIDTAGETNDAAALDYLNEAVQLDANNEIAYAKIGEIWETHRDDAKAIEGYENALRINPRYSAIYVPAGLVYLRTGNIEKADVFAAKADMEGPETAESKYFRGLVYVKQNKNAEALAAFDRSIELDPENISVQYQRAAVYDRLGQGDQAVASYRQILEKEPTYAAAWFDLGVAYYNRGEYDNAVGAYTEAIKHDVGNAYAHANLASTYRQLERYPEANAEYKIAAETIKDDPNLYSEWGFCLGKTKEWDKSVARLETAEQISPTAVDHSNVGWGYYNSAQEDLAAKNEPEATAKLEKSKESLTKAVEKDPKLDAAYVNLGSTNNALGDYEAAVAALNIALTLHSDWVIALNQLGIGHRGLNNLTAAVSTFTRVVALDGNNLAGLFNLGSAQHASGDKKGAKKTQDRLKKLNPELASQLGNVIAGRAIDEGKRRLLNKVPIRLPF